MSTFPKKSILKFTALILVVGLVLFVGFHFGTSPTKTNSTLKDEPTIEKEVVIREGLPVPTKNNSVVKKQENLITPKDFEENLPVKNESQQSQEKAQLEWENKAGFLTSEKRSDYFKLSLDDLRNLADSGDSAAMHILGWRLGNEGDPEEGLNYLKAAVADGSVSAAIDLSESYKRPGRFGHDLVEAYAWRRVAEAMGAFPDLVGSIRFEKTEDARLADVFFYLYFLEVQQAHIEQYGFPLPYNPQPFHQEGG